MEGKLHINTTAVHGGGRKDDCFGAINEPIYMTSNYRIPTDGTPVDWILRDAARVQEQRERAGRGEFAPEGRWRAAAPLGTT